MQSVSSSNPTLTAGPVPDVFAGNRSLCGVTWVLGCCSRTVAIITAAANPSLSYEEEKFQLPGQYLSHAIICIDKRFAVKNSVISCLALKFQVNLSNPTMTIHTQKIG